jgi:beta-xylosidase
MRLTWSNHRPPRFVVAVILLIFLLAGCGSDETTETPQPTLTPTAGAMATTESVSEEIFENPVLRTDFPDPGVLEVDGVYYAYGTNASGKNVQLARSTDLVEWELLTDAMPALPSWAMLGGSFIWAPEVIQIGEQFVLYYTARDKAADRQCIGVATSDKPEGKFRDNNDAALVCQVEEGGSIDASPFRDEDGTLYLYWKNDGNCCSQATYLYVQELAPDGLSLVGEPTRLVRNDSAWEGHVVEAPTMWQEDGRYYLFFSANNYAGFEYAVGYATCDTAVGPCQDAAENPILASVMDQRPPVIGPGHQTIVRDDDGETWLVYHAWEVLSSGTRGGRRMMWIDRLIWNDGLPDIEGPTQEPQAIP